MYPCMCQLSTITTIHLIDMAFDFLFHFIEEAEHCAGTKEFSIVNMSKSIVQISSFLNVLQPYLWEQVICLT